MRKSVLLAAGLAIAWLGSVDANAAVKSYWDQATGKWLKYDTDAKRVVPKNYSPIKRQTVKYDGPFKPNTIVVNTAEARLYYILEGGKALKYGVGVGKEGFQWSGADWISRKAEWPGWTPPPEMIAREKKKGRILPAYMEGGPKNPLGARALYIGGTLYRIHGSNEPWSIGRAVSSGCIRLTNDDVTHLYERVKVGSRVVVLTGRESNARLAALANPPPPAPKEPDPVVADLEEPMTKDDGVVVLAPDAEPTGSIVDGARVKDDDVLVVAPVAAVAVVDEVRVKDDEALVTPVATEEVVVEEVVVEAPVKDDDVIVPAAEPAGDDVTAVMDEVETVAN
ncbi:L,D-transpeptidase [Bauldia litoralis]|uniref:L,D-transpeptidase catalytic domain n=1 Tax=Bauldia litoralis TaxID=665467 RepID=A0A1G6CH45_9HYPH|nr:L,D-transpeptidase catalytic domain [Bauldia litoralis]